MNPIVTTAIINISKVDFLKSILSCKKIITAQIAKVNTKIIKGGSILALIRGFGALMAALAVFGMIMNSRQSTVASTEQSLIQRAYHVKMVNEKEVNSLFNLAASNEMQDLTSLKSTVYK